MNSRRHLNTAHATRWVLVGFMAVACGDAGGTGPLGQTGGTVSASGGAESLGGNTAIGGADVVGGTGGGGNVPNGASTAVGGNLGSAGGASGGTNMGGAPAGGTPAGGASTGDATTGGSSSGGVGVGGAAGGSSSTGGVSMGGTATGGASTGGASTGGASTGGSSSGGASGASTGGGGTGGAATGGTNTGGANTGGVSTGGAGTGGEAQRSSGCGATSWPTSSANNTIDVNGSSRSYILRIPDDYDPDHPYRLIVSFHCLNATAAEVANGGAWFAADPYYGLWNLANGSTIFVAPQGIGNAWPNSGGQDLAFTRALIAQLESQLCIDTSRVFAEGFSMGGSMSYAVACAMGDVVRGVAVHSGGPMSGCDQSNRQPVAYFMTHGTTDDVCTYPEYGVPQLEDFAELNGCDSLTLPTPSGTAPSCVDFANCTPEHPTRACIFVGGHTPSPPSTANTWVPQETWDFISQF